jgi:hypothetical protein
LQKNVDPMAAAAQAFGDLDELELNLRRHAASGQYQVSEMPGTSDVDDSSFIVQPLSQTQADTRRAELLAHVGRTSDARALLDDVPRNDSANVGARETSVFVGCSRVIKITLASLAGRAKAPVPTQVVGHPGHDGGHHVYIYAPTGCGLVASNWRSTYCRMPPLA